MSSPHKYYPDYLPPPLPEHHILCHCGGEYSGLKLGKGNGKYIGNFNRWYQICAKCNDFLAHGPPTPLHKVPEDVQLDFAMRQSAQAKNDKGNLPHARTTAGNVSDTAGNTSAASKDVSESLPPSVGVKQTYARPLPPGYGHAFVAHHHAREARADETFKRQKAQNALARTATLALWDGAGDEGHPWIHRVQTQSLGQLCLTDHPEIIQRLAVPTSGRVLLRKVSLCDTQCLGLEDEIGRVTDKVALTVTHKRTRSSTDSSNISQPQAKAIKLTGEEPTNDGTILNSTRNATIQKLPFTYVCQHVTGMTIMLDVEHQVSETFKGAFPGTEWVRSTFYKTRALYIQAREQGILDEFIDSGETPQGRWSELRKRLDASRNGEAAAENQGQENFTQKDNSTTTVYIAEKHHVGWPPFAADDDQALSHPNVVNISVYWDPNIHGTCQITVDNEVRVIGCHKDGRRLVAREQGLALYFTKRFLPHDSHSLDRMLHDEAILLGTTSVWLNRFKEKAQTVGVQLADCTVVKGCIWHDRDNPSVAWYAQPYLSGRLVHTNFPIVPSATCTPFKDTLNAFTHYIVVESGRHEIVVDVQGMDDGGHISIFDCKLHTDGTTPRETRLICSLESMRRRNADLKGLAVNLPAWSNEGFLCICERWPGLKELRNQCTPGAGVDEPAVFPYFLRSFRRENNTVPPSIYAPPMRAPSHRAQTPLALESDMSSKGARRQCSSCTSPHTLARVLAHEHLWSRRDVVVWGASSSGSDLHEQRRIEVLLLDIRLAAIGPKREGHQASISSSEHRDVQQWNTKLHRGDDLPASRWRFSTIEIQAILIELLENFEFSSSPGNPEIVNASKLSVVPTVSVNASPISLYTRGFGHRCGDSAGRANSMANVYGLHCAVSSDPRQARLANRVWSRDAKQPSCVHAFQLVAVVPPTQRA
ncbi:hypothetical protein JB92DRAFT_3119984 [Gautieria morchelliformis]|nr:hypothetical protein JB92DRAFT_3119984 [Gautieria morchelliformis]